MAVAGPVNFDVHAYRSIPYSERFSFLGLDWTGSTFRGQVRTMRDTTGTPLADFSAGIVLDYAGAATVAAHIAAGRTTFETYGLTNPATGQFYQPGDSLTLSWLRLSLDVGTVDSVPYPEERGDDAVAYYDVQRLTGGSPVDLVLRGQFIVHAGVTI